MWGLWAGGDSHGPLTISRSDKDWLLCSVKYLWVPDLLFHTLWAGRGRGQSHQNLTKAIFLSWFVFLYQKWRLARPRCYSPDSFVRRQKVSDSIWHSERGRILSGEAAAVKPPEPWPPSYPHHSICWLGCGGKFGSNLGLSFNWNIAFVWLVM